MASKRIAKEVARGRRTREPIEFLPVESVLDGNLDLCKVIQDVELGEIQDVVSVDQARVLHDDEVEPATAPPPAGRDAPLAPNFLKVNTDVL